MRPRTLAFLAIAALIVAGLIVMHGDGRGVFVGWLRSLHGAG
jgi:hypothetical protein